MEIYSSTVTQYLYLITSCHQNCGVQTVDAERSGQRLGRTFQLPKGLQAEPEAGENLQWSQGSLEVIIRAHPCHLTRLTGAERERSLPSGGGAEAEQEEQQSSTQSLLNSQQEALKLLEQTCISLAALFLLKKI